MRKKCKICKQKMSYKLKLFLITGMLIPLASLLTAHSGRTDSSGGHYNRKSGGYHYHGGGRSSTRSYTPSTSSEPAIKSAVKNASSANKQYSNTFRVVRVKKVIAGDTIQVIHQTGLVETIRLIGVDTSKTVDSKKQVQYFEKKAYTYTKKMLHGQILSLKYGDTKRDKNRKLLAYVYLGDGTLFNEKIIADGYAYTYTKYPFKKEFITKFKAAELQAKSNKKGLWADSKKNKNIKLLKVNDPIEINYKGEAIKGTIYKIKNNRVLIKIANGVIMGYKRKYLSKVDRNRIFYKDYKYYLEKKQKTETAKQEAERSD